MFERLVICHSVLEQFQSHLEESRLIPEGVSVLVGFSGGPDSTCLLELLHQAKVDVVAAHLNHQQRPEADQDVAHCQAFCDERKIPIVVGKADVPKIAADHKIGIEEAGRQARYTFFQQAAFQTNCQLVATAHTLDDQLETVIFHLARGTGMNGLSGIPEHRDNIIRPLLPFSRQQIQDFCNQQELPTLHDAGNDNIEFSRVRIRKRIVPELEAINPEIRHNVARAANLLEEENHFLNGMAAASLEQAEIPINGNLGFISQECEVLLDREKLAVYPDVILRRALRMAVEFIGAQLDYDLTLALTQAVKNSEHGAITLEGGKVVAEYDGQTVHIRDLYPAEPFRFPLTVPGETVSDVFGWQLVAESWPPTDFKREPGSLEVVLDQSKIQGSLHFRSFQDGDKTQPLGMNGQKLVSDILGERKLTLAARKRIPIICDMSGPVWIPGCCLAERVKIEPGSQKALRLRLEPLQSGGQS